MGGYKADHIGWYSLQYWVLLVLKYLCHFGFNSLNYGGIDSIIDWVNLRKNDIYDFELEKNNSNKAMKAVPFAKKEKKKLKQILTWTKWFYKKNSQISQKALTSADLETFLPDVAPNEELADRALSKKVHVKFNSKMKLDVKQYPSFDSSKTNWLKFKCKVLSLIATCGLDEVLDPQYTP